MKKGVVSCENPNLLRLRTYLYNLTYTQFQPQLRPLLMANGQIIFFLANRINRDVFNQLFLLDIFLTGCMGRTWGSDGCVRIDGQRLAELRELLWMFGN